MVDGAAAAGPPSDSHVDLSSCRPVGVIYSQCIRIIIFGELLWPYGHHHTPIRIAIHKSRVTMGLPCNGRIRSRCGVRSTNLMSRSIFSVRNSAGHRPRTHLLLSPVSDLWEYHEGHGDCMHCQVNHLISLPGNYIIPYVLMIMYRKGMECVPEVQYSWNSNQIED